MKVSTTQVLKILYLLSWIIFVGVCIEAGGFISNAVFMLVLNPVGARHLWQEVDLSALYRYDRGYFLVETGLMSIVAVLRAWIFYLILKILHDKKLDVYRPFNREVTQFISRISYLALLTGIVSCWGVKYAEWFVRQGVKMPDVEYLRLGGADVWLFMGVILFVIAQLFRRGIEIQTENELTV
jgi:ABC-type antimicrobial peptide transport system permease subunit